MNDKERRLARLEAAAPENWTPWRSFIWDPAIETREEAKARAGLADWTGNLICHEIVHPKPRPEPEAAR
jgi:hypothetical protein